MTASTRSNGARSTAACGKNGIAKRKNPYAPIFSMTPASTTEPAVGASVCASGSQVWNGKSGTLTANPTAKARKRTFAVPPWTCAAAQSVSVRTSNVNTCVECWYMNATDKIPANKNAEPAAVNKKNFMAA